MSNIWQRDKSPWYINKFSNPCTPHTFTLMIVLFFFFFALNQWVAGSDRALRFSRNRSQPREMLLRLPLLLLFFFSILAFSFSISNHSTLSNWMLDFVIVVVIFVFVSKSKSKRERERMNVWLRLLRSVHTEWFIYFFIHVDDQFGFVLPLLSSF